jgi:hypothetical protein
MAVPTAQVGAAPCRSGTLRGRWAELNFNRW